MKNPFFPLAEQFYKKLRPVIGKKKNDKVCKKLLQLHPLESAEKLYDQFQIKKIAAMFMIFTIGVVSAVCLHLCSRMDERLVEGTRLIRNEWGVGDYIIILRAKTEEWERKIPFLVEERRLSTEERRNLQKQLYEELPDLIRNKNDDLAHVTSNLNLTASVSGYPFCLTWNSSDMKRIDKNGNVNREGIATKEKVELTVTMSYGQEKEKFVYEVFLLPEASDEEEIFFQSLEDRLSEVDLEGKSLKQITLPVSLQGRGVEWKEIRQDYTVFLFFIILSGCVMVGRGMEKDLEKDCKKRNKQLLLDYPGFVSKLRLYLSAGLTVKNAFFRIMKDYESRKEQTRKYLYEEMKISCCQLENGKMEEQVYREFGKRCEEARYRRLGFLLAVHLKQGNSQLLSLLSEEADNAQEDQRNMARKAGEEAGTRLLFPMTLMLVVVMFLILLPAYLDFGTI